jgi:predicted nuclease of predicted toxin-antitoxin system
VGVLVDENLPRGLATALAAAGHDTEHARTCGLRGRPDVEVLAWANARKQVLFTADVGFGNVMAYPPGSHAGIVLSRVPTTTRAQQQIEILVRAAASLEATSVEVGSLVVVNETSMRIRGPRPLLSFRQEWTRRRRQHTRPAEEESADSGAQSERRRSRQSASARRKAPTKSEHRL